MDPSEFVNGISNLFGENADPVKAIGAKKYMRNQFEFFGVNTPDRKSTTRDYLKENGLPIYSDIDVVVKTAWELPEREMQYFAQGLCEKYLKEAQIDFIELLEYMVVNKSWWDTVDYIAATLVGGHLKNYPELIGSKGNEWINSNNMWLQRTAILFQLKYKNDTDFDLLAKYIDIANKSDNSEEFFIQKSIGWVLREYSKTEPEIVTEYIKRAELAPLSKREGMKWMDRQKKKTI